MSDLQVIESAVRRAARRRRRARALRGLWRGLLVGTILWLGALGAYKLFPIPLWVLGTTGVLATVAAVAGFVFGGWRKASLDETARWVDLQEHLQERLSTALEVTSKPADENWRTLVVTDAATRASELDPRRLVRFNLSKSAYWAALLLAAAAGLGFVPEYRSKKFLQKQSERENMREVGARVAELTRRDLEQRPPALEATEKAMESVINLGDELARARLTRSEALKDLASVSDKLKEQLKELGRDPALKRLEQAARAPTGANSQSAASLQKQIEALQKSLGTSNRDPQAMEKLQKDLQKLQEAAKAVADKSAGGSDQERESLSQSLSALANQAQALGLDLPKLDEAIAALAANQTDLFLKDLQSALTDLEKMRDMAKALQQLQAQAEQLGKDLAEQLERGQAEAAQDTLRKMAGQLQSASLTPEQLQKLLEEVSRAVDPASPYGKVAAHLKAACQQMQQGDQTGAAQSLAAAAKELEKLMQEMGDAQSLLAALETLQQASLCIGSCKGWGMCNRPGIGKGGKPGSGVGTWADEDSGWLYDGQWTELWDNTGLTRPDMEGRGLTERSSAAGDDKFTPSKVKGQFSPGGPMPSISLKGVSIKGESRIGFEEAVAAAQSDAQNALSQERVPRAYQNAVRDYFDDLEK